MEAITFIHTFIGILIPLYILAFRTVSKYDIYLIYYVLLLVLHWIYCKNECIISYIYKKYNNNDYKLGQDPLDLPDIANTIAKYSIVNNFFLVAFIICSYVLFSRNKYIPHSLTLLVTIGISCYIIVIRQRPSIWKEIFNEVLKFVIIITMVIIAEKKWHII